MTMAKTIMMEPLRKHIRYILCTGNVANKKRSVSTIILSPPERAKSTETLKFDEEGCNCIFLNNFTSWGLRDLIAERERKGLPRAKFVIVPDMERIKTYGRNIRAQMLADMRFTMEEGMIRVHTFNSKLDLSKNPYQIAFIICTTKDDVGDGRSIYRKGTSLASRWIPFSYDFSDGMKEAVLQFVMTEASNLREDKESLIDETYTVDLPDMYRRPLKMYAKYLAWKTGKWTSGNDDLIGVRALENLQTYIRGIAVHNGRQRVTAEEFDEFEWLYNWMNYDYQNIDEFIR
jgi:hypothetical protein